METGLTEYMVYICHYMFWLDKVFMLKITTKWHKSSRPPKFKCYFFFASEVALLEAVGWVANRVNLGTTWEGIFVAAEALLIDNPENLLECLLLTNGEAHHGGSGCPCDCFGCHGQRKVRYEWHSFTSIHSLFLCVYLLLFWLKLMSHNPDFQNHLLW